MKIKDNIYGKFTIYDKVLIELSKNPLLLRLKGVSQYGIPDEYYHHKNYSRYEHSIGVMLLLKKLRATLEEQVAGLLHDVSTMVFSHVVDWVFADGGNKESAENYHDTIHKDFIGKSKIPIILKKYGFDCDRLLNEENFGLLERNSPDLCADRVDYALREFKYWLKPKIVKECVDGLANLKGEIIFRDKDSAYTFASNYLELQTQHWGGYEAVMRYHLFSNILKHSLKRGIINRNDFFKEESKIVSKLKRTRDSYIQETLTLLKNKSLENFKKGLGRKIYKKFRFTDPKILVKGKLVRLSKLESSYKKLIEKHKKINQKGLVV